MPRWMDRMRLRLRSLFRRTHVDAELSRELRFHLEHQIEENLGAGMEPEEARAAALRAFGSVAHAQDACRDTWRVALLQNLSRDVRYAVRSLGKQPLLLVAAISSIALGVGANTTVFSLANELLLAAPTTDRADRLVHIRTSQGSHVSYREWRDLHESGSLAGLAGYQVEHEVNWRAGDRAVTVIPLIVTANFFDLLGVPVAMGRAFTAAEASAERDPRVAVVSHGFWQRHLGADPAAIGKTLVLNGEPYTILGVLPRRLRAFPGYGIAPEVYVPLSRSLMPDLDEPLAGAVALVGRLQDDQTLGEARAALAAAAERLELGEITRFSPVVLGQRDFPGITAFLALLLVVVGLVLVIACANVTGLLLARGTVRRREMALRAALGASRGRLVQQLLTESLCLALIGSACGLLLSFVSMQALARVPLPLPLPLELRMALDLRLLVYLLAVIILSTLLTGVVPAWRATRPSLVPAIKIDESRFTRRRLTLGGLLVIGQVTVSLVLLVTAFLFLRNLARTHTADPGFDTRHTLMAQVSFVEGRHAPEARASLLISAVERVRSLPGIESATFAWSVPLTIRSGRTVGMEVGIEGTDRTVQMFWEENHVGPGYFRTMGIPLRSGRDFSTRDGTGAPSVIIVNQELVRRYLPDMEPLGVRLLLPGPDGAVPREIVGVVGNGKHRMLGESQQAAIYVPYLQRESGRFVHVLARASASPEGLLRAVERVILDLDPTAAAEAQTVRAALAFAFLPSHVGAALLGSLGGLGLMLAMAGFFALLSYSVARRTREIGIRMALGASERAVARLVLVDAAILVVIGVLAGLGIAVFVTRPLAMFLVSDLSPGDPVSFAATAALLVLVSLVASWIPMRRAMGIQPVVTLRDE